MNEEIQKIKTRIKEYSDAISFCHAEIQKIRLTCPHEWVHSRYGFQQEIQKCALCEKERWRESIYNQYSTTFAQVHTCVGPIRHKDGWFYTSEIPIKLLPIKEI